MITDFEPRPHALYRFFSSDGVLLYVGISSNIGARWKGHAKDKPWWCEVASTTIEHFPNRYRALDAERRAIKTERPKYNVIHNSAASDVNPPPPKASSIGADPGVSMAPEAPLRPGALVAVTAGAWGLWFIPYASSFAASLKINAPALVSVSIACYVLASLLLQVDRWISLPSSTALGIGGQLHVSGLFTVDGASGRAWLGGVVLAAACLAIMRVLILTAKRSAPRTGLAIEPAREVAQ